MKSRMSIVIVVIGLMWLALLGRGAYLQVLPDERLQKLKDRQFSQSLTLRPQRGSIVDREGNELAVSVEAYSLFADPQLIKAPNSVARKLAKTLKMSRKSLQKKLRNKKRRFVWIKRRLDKDTKEEIRQWGHRGLGFVKEPKRIYPHGHSLSQVLGITGAEGKGLEGLEYYYDELLAGQELQVKVQRDAWGRPLISESQYLEQKVHATDLQLTIDSEIQYVMEKELSHIVEKLDAESGVGVVMNAQSSEVLAMVSVPTFDANRPGKYSAKLRRNRVVTDFFEPGSTMKSFLVAGALKRGIVKPNSRYFCENGRMKIGRRFIRESDSRHKWGDLSVGEILAVSSNICSAKIGFDLTAEKLRETLLNFGFGQKFGIPFPGESKGLLQALPWRKHLLSNISFGHGIAVTPLQITAAYTAIANGGVLKEPLLVKGLRNSKSYEMTSFEPKVIRRVLSEKQAETMRLMLMGVTAPGGTGANARVDGFPVAGKTGTAQKVREDGRGYLEGAYISSFAGFIPAHDPRFVIYVAVDNPQKHYYGSQVAAPVFSKVASYAVRKAGLSPVFISEKNMIPEGKLKTHHSKLESRTSSRIDKAKKALNAGKMPRMKNLSLRDAVHLFSREGIRVVPVGEGMIFESHPKPGAKLSQGDSVKIYLK